MHFTLWPSRTANEGGHAVITWEAFLAFVAAPAVAADKNALEGWSPAKFAGNRRAKAGVEAVSAIVLDDDSGSRSLEQITFAYAAHAGLVHSSHSHTDAWPKWRIVLRTSRNMTAAEHARVWEHVRGPELDEATRDASRLWYVPAHAPGAPYVWATLEGAPLDVDAILAQRLEPADAPALTRAGSASNRTGQAPSAGGPTRDPASRRAAMAQALGAAWPAKGRHEAQLALAGALKGEGFTEAEAVDFLCLVCRAAGDEDRPKREATVRHTWGASVTTGWTRLKAHVDPVVVDAARGALARGAEWTESTMRRLAAEAAPLPNVGTSEQVPTGRFAFEVGGLDAELPPIDYQIDTLVARGDVVMLVAHGNSLKTWLAFSMAHAVASGRPWLGKYVTQRGRAALLDYESGTYEVKRRLKLLGARDADVADRLLRSSFPVANLEDPEAWIELAGSKPEFVVVDSFNAAASGETNENDAEAANVLKLAGRFAETMRCTVTFIHHSRKGSGGDRREAVRGSTAIFAACDRIFEFYDLEKNDAGVVATTITSLKDGAGRRPADFRVELSDQGLRWVEIAPEAKEEAKPVHEKNRAAVFAILRQNSAGVAKEHLIDAMEGKRDGKFKLLADLFLAGLTVEFQDRSSGGKGKAFVMLKPGVEP